MISTFLSLSSNRRQFNRLRIVPFFYLFEEKKPDFFLRSFSGNPSELEQAQSQEAEEVLVADGEEEEVLVGEKAVISLVTFNQQIIKKNSELHSAVMALVESAAGIAWDPGTDDYIENRAACILSQRPLVEQAFAGIKSVFQIYKQNSSTVFVDSEEDRSAAIEEFEAATLLSLASFETFANAIQYIPLLVIKVPKLQREVADCKVFVKNRFPKSVGPVRSMMSGLYETFSTAMDSWTEIFNEENTHLSEQSTAGKAYQKVAGKSGAVVSRILSAVASPSAPSATSVILAPPVSPAVGPLSKDQAKALGKLMTSQNLTSLEQAEVKSIGVGQLASIAHKEFFGMFQTEIDTVIKIRFNFRVLNIFTSGVSLIDSNGNLLEKRGSVENMNCATFTSEIYYAVGSNNLKVKTEDVFAYFYQTFFVLLLEPLLSEVVVLEAIQIQNFWPKKALYEFEQETYDVEGACIASDLVSSKPFCFNLTSSLFKSKKNAFKFSIGGVSKRFQDRAILKAHKAKLEEFCKALEKPVKLGTGEDLVLYCVVPTRTSNSLVPFVPVTGCSIGGFGTNHRKSLLFRASKTDTG